MKIDVNIEAYRGRDDLSDAERVREIFKALADQFGWSIEDLQIHLRGWGTQFMLTFEVGGATS